MLLFIDESGFDHSGTPCEVLAGVAIAEDSLWNLVRAVRGTERELFGDYLRTFLIEERKAKRMLKMKRFRSANRNVSIAPDELAPLAHSTLVKGKLAREQGLDHDGTTQRELVAYILGWGWRLQQMPQAVRTELQPYASKLHDMQFHGEKPKADGTGVWQLHGITYLDDLRSQADKEAVAP
ncbi:MAG TPA: hypothetical protein VNX28_17305 [Gemmataceae bacterium]|jgi:hypothetical protein|nr:hypothetical protein [Gemmataceae bacterium]